MRVPQSAAHLHMHVVMLCIAMTKALAFVLNLKNRKLPSSRAVSFVESSASIAVRLRLGIRIARSYEPPADMIGKAMRPCASVHR